MGNDFSDLHRLLFDDGHMDEMVSTTDVKYNTFIMKKRQGANFLDAVASSGMPWIGNALMVYFLVWATIIGTHAYVGLPMARGAFFWPPLIAVVLFVVAVAPLFFRKRSRDPTFRKQSNKALKYGAIVLVWSLVTHSPSLSGGVGLG